MYRQLLGLRLLSRRTITSSARRQANNGVKEKQKLFQAPFCHTLKEDNGLPIHLKGGVKDALIYRFTMALTVFGSGYVVYELFTAAMPKKA
ncbi:cytochrome c oxidase subunit 7A2a isoform X1 [Pseudochaenichthys georgianus]|uniref:cytochrome c oxidase subunit 7A2a isoform X1 n=1 Tax=Pseudochaenichthys georgianus TaxID=52239 RepID=UPI00146AE651|nr:cytochrome c oxidase subunit 7A2, mitochondrial isoform X1 [Pseudochaenichthys georgianus]